MTFDEVALRLSAMRREELRDHAFGDRELYWYPVGVPANIYPAAQGYIGSTGANVYVYNEEGETAEKFEGQAALKLAQVGTEVVINRNDETGPDEYQDGVGMPGLTRDGVRDALNTVSLLDPDLPHNLTGIEQLRALFEGVTPWTR